MSIYKIFDLTILLTIISMIPMLVMAWIGVVAAWGLIKKKRPCPPLTSDHEGYFGIIVCAHNEETSIGSLLKSIEAQNYPADRFHVFLLCDHCTDRTAEVGAGFSFVTVMKRETGPTNGKGDVLKWGLKQVFSADSEKKIDYIGVFDADNVLRPDFLEKMDIAMRSGNLIVQGNRLGGQPYRSVITKWYTLYWVAYSIFFSYVREKVGISCFLTGTGFAVNADLLRKEGWNTETITEDVEFSIQNVLKGRRVAFCIDAVCYDEQPYRFMPMVHQLARWCTGGYQVLNRNFKQLMKKSDKVRNIQRIDVLMLLLMGPCSWISFLISLVNWIIMFWNLPLFFFIPSALANFFGLIFTYIGILLAAKAVHIPRRKVGIWAVLTFPVFLYVYMICSIKTCFLPSKKWRTVKHEALNVDQT